MPNIDVEFEVICGTCGKGLCLQSDVRYSRSRNTPQVIVAVCEDCIDNATSPLKQTIEELKAYIKELESERGDGK